MKRTLDLKASDIETRVKWERYFRLFLLQRKGKNKEAVGGEKEQKKQAEKEKLSEVENFHSLIFILKDLES